MKKQLLILSFILLPLPAMAANKPTSMSNAIINKAFQRYTPSFCKKTVDSFKETAKKVKDCYQKTSKDNPNIEVCVLGDEVMSSMIHAMQTVSDVTGREKLSIPFFSDEEISNRATTINNLPKYKNYTDQEKKAYQEHSINAFFDKAIDFCKSAN